MSYKASEYARKRQEELRRVANRAPLRPTFARDVTPNRVKEDVMTDGELKGDEENLTVDIELNQPGGTGAVETHSAYDDYGDLSVDEVLAKVDSGDYDRAQVVALEQGRDKPRKGVLEALAGPE